MGNQFLSLSCQPIGHVHKRIITHLSSSLYAVRYLADFASSLIYDSASVVNFLPPSISSSLKPGFPAILGRALWHWCSALYKRLNLSRYNSCRESSFKASRPNLSFDKAPGRVKNQMRGVVLLRTFRGRQWPPDEHPVTNGTTNGS